VHLIHLLSKNGIVQVRFLKLWTIMAATATTTTEQAISASPSTMPIEVRKRHFHIFGHGISFSKSPAIHTAAFRHYGLPYTYDIQETESIDDVAHLIQDSSFGGASVTMPHKLAVHKFCTQLTENARMIGAVNTLIVGEQEQEIEGSRRAERGSQVLTGDNTDWAGLQRIIKKHTESWPQSPRTGLVIGAGGASRAAVYALHLSGLKTIYIVNRTIANAEKIAQDFQNIFQTSVLPSLDSLVEAPDVIVGTIPADRTSKDDFLNGTLFGKSRGLCIDMSYKPRRTPLLAAAERQIGWATVPGLEVLLHQALTQFELWTGLPAPEEVMEREIDADNRQTDRTSRDGKL
jgi:shikimate-5-dehydrogenase